MKLAPTASQTIGPYLRIGVSWLTLDRVAGPDCPGEHVSIAGRVLDADGQPVNDALVEIWQADSHGKYAHPEDTTDLPGTPGFRGFGRVPTDDAGRFQFHTIKPGPVPDMQGGWQAPHVMVSVFMRGLLKRVVTRIYFPDEPLNARDPVLQSVPAGRRGTLVARRAAPHHLEWDVVLQGAGETVFFDC
jgi:protocatechuate 3,4-dioxygenase alpha subunit